MRREKAEACGEGGGAEAQGAEAADGDGEDIMPCGIEGQPGGGGAEGEGEGEGEEEKQGREEKGPDPPSLDTHLPQPPETPIWTLRFCLHKVHAKILGTGQGMWRASRGIHQEKLAHEGPVHGEWMCKKEGRPRQWTPRISYRRG